MKNKFLTVLVILAGIIILNLTRCEDVPNNVQPLIKSWEKAVPHQEIPEGLLSLSAEHCGSCHPQHYEEWKYSTHSHAWTDLQFQAELKKESSPYLCINCHIPLQNQQEYIVSGLIDGDIYQPVREKNPQFDRKLQQEGINCASCHVRNNTIIATSISGKAPHLTLKDTLFLSEKLCISCHNAIAVVTPSLVCSFETGDEWKSGPYFEEKNCISCHMELTMREISPGFGERISHLHYVAGSGIPKFDTVETKILNGLSFFPSSLEDSYFINEEMVFDLKVKNELAGHNVPTGDPERFFMITFEIINESGIILTTQNHRIGETWEWHPEAKKITDNNLIPNEERTFTFSHKVVEKGKYTLRVKVTKNRLDKKSAEYNNLKDNYPLFITVFNEKYDIVVE